MDIHNFTHNYYLKKEKRNFIKTVLNDEEGISKFLLVKKLKNSTKKVSFFSYSLQIFFFRQKPTICNIASMSSISLFCACFIARFEDIISNNLFL